jgi:elongator complex protein 1
LKQEITAPASQAGESGRFTSVDWHPENPSCLILTTSSMFFASLVVVMGSRFLAQLIYRTYGWETFSSLSQTPFDSGNVAVFDGSTFKSYQDP